MAERFYRDVLYEVDRIVDKRTDPVTQATEYLVKWISYGDEENTWEPEENLVCPELIAEFEAERAGQEEATTESKPKSPCLYCQELKKIALGFERGLEPKKILSATEISGKLMFLIEWEGTDEADLVLATEANIRCPQLVIKFYEERLFWRTPDEA